MHRLNEILNPPSAHFTQTHQIFYINYNVKKYLVNILVLVN